jgi:uncharacterized membrane protein
MVSVPSLTFGLSFIAAFLHFFANWFVGTHYEGGLAFVLWILWCAVLPALLDNEDAISVVSPGTGVLFANAFFSAWGCFILAMWLFFGHTQVQFKREDNETWFTWGGFSVSCLVVLSASVVFWGDFCENLDDAVCSRAMLGIVLSAMSAVMGIGLMFQPDKRAEQWASLVLFVAWCFAVSFITYNTGHGVAVGTLYFATWICMLLSMHVATKSLWEWMKERNTPAAAEEAAPDDKMEGGDKAAGGDEEEEEVEKKDEAV